MATCLRRIKRTSQGVVNELWAYYKLAKRNEYSEEQSKQLAVYVVERNRPAGGWEFLDLIQRIERQFPYKGKETAFHELNESGIQPHLWSICECFGQGDIEIEQAER